ncbi:MAG: septum site-determining protein MinD, partial [Eubacteriales bacterium]|jgi:septum site-determining protein MinD
MVVVSTNRGETVLNDERAKSGQAFRNIVRRIKGESVPLMDLDGDGLLSKLRRFIGLK